MKQQGFAMIEVLVSVLILAVGLVGLAASHITSTKTTRQGNYRTVAVTIANDTANRLRSGDNDVSCDDDASSPGCRALTLPNGNLALTYTGPLIDITVSWDELADDVERQSTALRIER